MWFSPFFSRASITSILYFFSCVRGQSISGASFFLGNGAPGAGQYYLVDNYEGSSGFFNKFNFYSSYDPTYGHVQYLDESIAVQNGYVTTSNHGTALISVDTTNKWPNGGPGRPAVRLISDNTYTHGLFILDLIHMPFGCGTWPAYWLLGPDWPYNGEIDIIEGVNTIGWDSVTLHTSANCLVSGSGQTGIFQTSDCSGGCGSILSNSVTPNNYGDSLNDIGGGVYATEWTSNYIKTWFFPRNGIPASITSGAPNPAADFGIPAVNQQGSCQIDQHFNNMSIIINTDFCGAWAGQVYRGSYPSCPQNASASNSLDACVDFVGNNPSNFTNAYWEINSIKVYQMALDAQPSSSYTTSLSSVMPLASTQTVPKGMGSIGSTIPSSMYTGPLSSLSSETSYSSGSSAMASTTASNPRISSVVEQPTLSASNSVGSVLTSTSTSLSYLAILSTSGLTSLSTSSSTSSGSSVVVPNSPLSSSGLSSPTSSGSWSPGVWHTGSLTMQPSSQLPQTSPSSVPPCPNNVSALCSTPNASKSCSISSGDTFNMTCGIIYEGTVIQPTGTGMVRRTFEPTVQGCQTLCQYTPTCIALNYEGTDCQLLSSVTGTSYVPGAVAGSIVQSSTTASSSVSAYGATVTITPSHGITVTVPASGYHTSGSSGSYYVYTTASTQNLAPTSAQCSDSVYLCYTCALTPTVVTGCPGAMNTGAPGNGATISNGPTASNIMSSSKVVSSGAGTLARTTAKSRNGTCTAFSGVRTTTMFTTHTITSCGMPAICPASGYILGGNATQSGAMISTTYSNGELVTYTQIPTSKTRHSSSSPTVTSTATPILNCPSSNNMMYSSPMGKQYAIFCDARGTTQTLQSQKQTDLASCIAACDMVNTMMYMIASPCLAVTFYPDEQSENCLLKTGFSIVDDASADSAYLLNPYAGPSKGNTISSVGISSSPIFSSMTRSGPVAPERLITITEIDTIATTAVSIVYQPITLPGGTITLTPAAVTVTATTVSVSISISDLIITETVTAPGQTVTATTYIYPSSSGRPFTCRTVATNYLDGSHGKAKRTDKRRIFDSNSFLLLDDIEKRPRPGAVPRL